MPIYWRYFIISFFKYFSLSLVAFIAMILVISLKEIALFASLSSSYLTTVLFTTYQVVHILPIAIPLCAFISSLIFIRKISLSYELNSFRTAGLSLMNIFAPILLLSCFLGLINLYIASELTTNCRLKTREILYNKTTDNPLTLLKKQNLLKLKDYYIDMDKNPLLILKDHKTNRLSLFQAKKLSLINQTLIGKDLLFLSYRPTQGFPTLMIENEKKLTTDATLVTKILKKSTYKDSTNALPMGMLLLKKNASFEIIRRISLALFVISLTFIALCLNTCFIKKTSTQNLLITIALATTSLILYLITKQMKNNFSYFFTFFPHILLFSIGFIYLKRLEKYGY